MTDTETAGVIGEAAAQVLETMFFAVPEPEPCESTSGETVCAQVNFTGSWSGRLELCLPADSAATISTDFLGLDFGEDASPEQIRHVVGEMANMVCGVALSRLEPEGAFDLHPPEAIEALTGECTAARTDVYLPEGPVRMQLITL